MADYIGHNFYIKPTYMVALPEYSGASFSRSLRQRYNEKNLRDNTNKGNLSNKSARKLMNAVNWLSSSAKDKALYSRKHNRMFYFKLNFITLTIPHENESQTSEKVAKRAIHTWLSYARKYFYLRNYLWKAEVGKQGMLHLHVTTDSFINHRRLRQSWNSILKREGLLNNYYNQHGHYDANSTDIHSVRKVRDISAYLASYMKKETKLTSKWKGRIWACNRELSDANKCQATIFAGSEDKAVQRLMSTEQVYKPILAPPDKFGNAKEIGQIYLMNEKRWQALQQSILKEAYDTHRFYIRNNVEKPPAEYFESFLNEYFEKHEEQRHILPLPAPSSVLTDTGSIHSINRRCSKSQDTNVSLQLTFEEILD